MLASGESLRSIHFQFRIGEKTLQRHFPRVCRALYKVLKDRYLKVNAVYYGLYYSCNRAHINKYDKQFFTIALKKAVKKT
jgi:hypothetical protein